MDDELDLGRFWCDAARLHAERIAVREGELELTYAELDQRVRALAGVLLAQGLEPGERVALAAENTSAYLAAYFAAPLAGLVLVPLNVRLAPAELVEVLADAGVRILLAATEFEALARELSERVLSLEPLDLGRAINTDSPAPEIEPRATDPDAVCQLYYTSGTTGRPKGVCLTHRNILSHARAVVPELDITVGDRWGHFAPMFHLADAWAVFALTRVGGVHVMGGRFDPVHVLETIMRQGVTATNLVPTMLARLLVEAAARAYDLSSMRLLLTGGAPIAPSVVRQALGVFDCEYVQTYGMTETSPFLTLGLLPPHLSRLPRDERLVYLSKTGRPFSGVELALIDEHGLPAPPDGRTVGEIRARGPSVTPGYWNRPEETAAAFIDGWLATGDLAVLDTEGFLQIVDRKKDVVLSGGETVYTTEVENALFSHPDVLEAAVFGLADEEWGEAVHAAVVPRPGRVLDPTNVAEHCRERIAGYKVPKRIHVMDDLPKTGSGKVAKHRLRSRFATPSLSPPSPL